MEHYETYGDRVMRLLADESQSPRIGEIVEQGRIAHREWCARVFAPTLDGAAAAPTASAAQPSWSRSATSTPGSCCAATRKLSRAQTELALVELLEPLTAGSSA